MNPLDDSQNDIERQQGAQNMAAEAGEPAHTVSQKTFFVAADGDSIGQKVGQAVLMDDLDGLKEISHSINAGQNMIIDWVESKGGDVISAGGDEIVAAFDEQISDGELESIRQKYGAIVGATLTMGVGSLPSEAGKALLFGKVNGKDQIAHFSPEVEEKLYQVHENPQTDEEMKQDEHYLGALDGESHDDDMDEQYYHDDHQEEGDNVSIAYADAANGDYQTEMVSRDDMGGEEMSDDFSEEQGSDYFDEDAFSDQGQEQGDFVDHTHEDDSEFQDDGDDDGWVDPELSQDDGIENPEEVVEQAALQENAGEEFSDDGTGESQQDDEMLTAMKDEMSSGGDMGATLKDRLGSVLEGYIQEKEQLEQLQMDNPELYQEVLLLLQQMISVAKQLNANVTPPPVEDPNLMDDMGGDPNVPPEEPSMGKPQP